MASELGALFGLWVKLPPTLYSFLHYSFYYCKSIKEKQYIMLVWSSETKPKTIVLSRN